MSVSKQSFRNIHMNNIHAHICTYKSIMIGRFCTSLINYFSKELKVGKLSHSCNTLGRMQSFRLQGEFKASMGKLLRHCLKIKKKLKLGT